MWSVKERSTRKCNYFTSEYFGAFSRPVSNLNLPHPLNNPVTRNTIFSGTFLQIRHKRLMIQPTHSQHSEHDVTQMSILLHRYFFFLMPPHVHTNFRGPPFWLWRNCNRLLILGRPWGAVALSRWCEGWYTGRWGARWGLKTRSTNYSDRGHHEDPPPTRKIPMVEPGIEPGTSWLAVRNSDH